MFKLNSMVMRLGYNERVEKPKVNVNLNYSVGDATVCWYEQGDECIHHWLGIRTMAEQPQTASMVF